MFRVTKWAVVRAVAFAALLLSASGEAAEPLTIVGELSIPQLKEFLSQAVAEVLPLHNNCTDHPDASDCDAVVENGLCTQEEFYARYCCRSCTQAKQIPTYGPHLRHVAKVPLTSKIVSTKSDNISCVVSGFPLPHVVWFRNGVDVSSQGMYEQKAEDLGGILIKRLRSDLIIRNATEDESRFKCMAINDQGFVSKSADIEEGRLQVEILPEIPIFRSDDLVTLKCIAKGRYVDRISWMLYTNSKFSILEDDDRYNITVTRTMTDGIATVINAVTFKASTEDRRLCFECIVEGSKYKETTKCVVTSDLSPVCEDTIDSAICFEDRYKCSESYYFYRFCCRTCTRVLNHKPESLEIVPGRPMLTADDDVTFECISRDAEVVNMTWTIDYEEIEDSEMYSITETEPTEDGVPTLRSKLSVLRQKVEHNGKELRCITVVRGMHISSNIKMITSHPPDVSVTAELTNPFGKETQLWCEANGFPNVNVTWFRGGKRIQESSSYRIEDHPSESPECKPDKCETMSILSIKRVTGDLLGRYVCRASNAVATRERGGTLALTEDGSTEWIED